MLEVQATLTTNFRALVFQRLRVTQQVPDYKKNVRCLDVKYFFYAGHSGILPQKDRKIDSQNNLFKFQQVLCVLSFTK